MFFIAAGKALEIVLSPAVKKPRSRVSPPTSPTAPPTLVHRTFSYCTVTSGFKSTCSKNLQLLKSANLMNNPQASIDQKLKEAEERKKSIETERLVNYLTPAKGDIIFSGSRTCRVSWPRLTSPSKRRRRARRPRFEILFFR